MTVNYAAAPPAPVVIVVQCVPPASAGSQAVPVRVGVDEGIFRWQLSVASP